MVASHHCPKSLLLSAPMFSIFTNFDALRLPSQQVTTMGWTKLTMEEKILVLTLLEQGMPVIPVATDLKVTP